VNEGRTLQRRGRAALCATLTEVGADAPTLCAGWRAIDLASHLVIRERDAWTAPVILCGRLNGIVERLTANERRRGFEQVVTRLAEGPPWLFSSTPLTVRLNTVEDWIHHQDVRRANALPRQPTSPELDDILWRGVGAAGKVAGLRLGDVGLDAVATDGRRITVKKGARVVEVVGPPGEVLLFVTGRTDVADVELRGADADVEDIRSAGLRL
jgi:uncharacterized protein (TIGR03085 family)